MSYLRKEKKMNTFISKLSKVRGLNFKNDYLYQEENTKFRFIKIKKALLPFGNKTRFFR